MRGHPAGRTSFGVIALALCVLEAGCGGGGSGGPPDSPPTISGFSFSPDAVYANSGSGSASVVGTVDFTDPNGDVTSLTLNVVDEFGTTVDTLTTPVQGVSGSTSGTIQGEIEVDTTQAGTFTVHVYLTDARSNRSNELEEQFRISEFPWVAKRPMPSMRRDFATATLGGLIYVTGGGDVGAGSIPAPAVTTVEVYDPATDSWTTSPPMPVAVMDHVAVAANGRLYVIGGESAVQPMVGTVQEYDPATQLWTIRTSMPTARRAHAAATLNGKIYVAGGSSAGFDVATVEVYDPVTDSWATETPLPDGRRDLAVAAAGGHLLAMGGYSGTYIPDGGYRRDVFAFDPAAHAWTPLSDMPLPRADFAVAVLNGLLFTAGGGNVVRALDDADDFDQATDLWTVRTPMPSALAWPRAEAVGGKIYVFDTLATYEYTPGNDIL